MQRRRLQLEGAEPPLLRASFPSALSPGQRQRELFILPKRAHLWVSGRSVMPGTVRKGTQSASAFSSVGAGGRWPSRTFPPCRWRRLSASLFAPWMTRCPECRTSGCGRRRVWGRPSRSLSLKRRMRTQRSERYAGLWPSETPVALLQYIPGAGRGLGLSNTASLKD